MFAELYCGMALAFTGCLTGGIDCFAESVVTVENDGNEILSSRCYKLSDNCAGPFRVGGVIPDKVDGLVITKTFENRSFCGKEFMILVYVYEIGNEGTVKVIPRYDPSTGRAEEKIGEIIVNSDLFLSESGIGAVSSMEEFVTAYPDFRIVYEHDTDRFYIETPGLKNVRFMISDEYYCGTDAIRSSAVDVELKISDFNEQSYFSVICIGDKNQQGKIK